MSNSMCSRATAPTRAPSDEFVPDSAYLEALHVFERITDLLVTLARAYADGRQHGMAGVGTKLWA